MKFIITDLSSNVYVVGNNEYTTDKQHAHAFGSLQDAVEVAAQLSKSTGFKHGVDTIAAEPELQYFWFDDNGSPRVFSTYVNGEGFYDGGNDTILGTVYTVHGQEIASKRVSYARLRPLSYRNVKSIFKPQLHETII